MKPFILILLIVSTLFAAKNDDQLMLAYQKEFSFLKAQKKSLKLQLKRLAYRHKIAISDATAAVDERQNRLLAYKIQTEAAQEKLHKIEISKDDSDNDAALPQTVIMQMKSSLKSYKTLLNENKEDVQTLSNGFEQTIKRLKVLESVTKEKGSFYLQDGNKVEGELIHVGNIATFGINETIQSALAPAGDGKLKVWPDTKSKESANALANYMQPNELNIFVYESLEKEVDYKHEKTLNEFISSGGLVGWSILSLGLIVTLLISMRIRLLKHASSDTDTITEAIVTQVQGKDVKGALKILKDYDGSTARIMKATLKNIEREREHIEDIVMENIIHESSQIDKFSSVILVVAAVAPLLGLLGTVTGMISTFDIITEFGTGDPKLLAGGISEALVTTELGLIVAIPALLVGNLLMGWGSRIKDSMEQHALHIVNQYNINN